MSHLRGFLTRHGKGWIVGAKDVYTKAELRQRQLDDLSPYRGPSARIFYDQQWLHIETDDYEGVGMLNIEALPQLRRVLAHIVKQLAAKAEASR